MQCGFDNVAVNCDKLGNISNVLLSTYTLHNMQIGKKWKKWSEAGTLESHLYASFGYV